LSANSKSKTIDCFCLWFVPDLDLIRVFTSTSSYYKLKSSDKCL
jgi:hypothetical protein